MNRPEIKLWVPGSKGALMLPLGDGQPTITGGHGGWETLDRPGRVASTRFSGSGPLQQDIPILLDGFARSRSVEPQIDRLISLTRPQKGTRPPVVKVAGPVHRTSLSWVIENVKWGASVRLPRGTVVRQELTLQLLQFVKSDRIGSRRPRMTAEWERAGMTSQWGTVTTKKGDTWRKLAVAHLGDATMWKALARRNGKRPNDPNTPLEPGRRVRLA